MITKFKKPRGYSEKSGFPTTNHAKSNI